MVKDLPTVWETRLRSLGWEDPLQKEMAIHSSNLAWKIPWMEEAVQYSPWGYKELDTTERLHFHFSWGMRIYILQKQKKKREALE